MRRIGMAVRVLLVIALVGLGLPAGGQAQGADDGLVAEWHFDEGSGSVLADSSGKGNDGVIYGATWVEGKYGQALEFDGRDDYVDCGNDAILDITDAITIEAWVKGGAQTKHPPIVAKYGSGNYYSYELFYATESNFIRFVTANGITTIWPESTTYIADNNWHFIVGTWDGILSKIYIDAIEEDSKSVPIPMHSNNDPVLIGSATRWSDRFWDGTIDEVRIYNRVLTAEEIKQHYEGKQTALSIAKSAAPHSIKQGQTTTVTLTVKNTGTTEITDIEVTDTIPSDLIFINGETSKTYLSLRPKDSREFQYVLQPSDAGTFNLDPATATYSDEEGNYHTAESETTTITVIQSTDQSATPHTTKKPSTDISTASVHLHGEKTDVVLGEEVLLKLSAVNIIGNPLMRVQVIIIPPSGWSVTSSEFAKSGAGQYTTTYDIESGVGRDIEVRIMPNQIGDDFQVQGRIIYYFGDDSDAREDHTLTLPITVRAEADNGQEAERTESSPESKGSSTPGFGAVVAGMMLFAIYLRRKRA